MAHKLHVKKDAKGREYWEGERRHIYVIDNDTVWVNRYIFAMGAAGPTLCSVRANSLDDAVESLIDWLAENMPGLLCDAEVQEAYQEAINEGLTDEEAWERATAETVTDDGSHFMLACELHLVAENPARREIAAILGGT